MGTRSGRRVRPDAPAMGGTAAGIVLAVSVFLPWYTTNIGPPFSATSASGWDSTMFARAAMGLGLVVALSSLALVLAGQGVLALERAHRVALAWATMSCAVAATALVAVRLVVKPDPADLLSRQVGLYLAMAAAAAAVLCALGQIATQDQRRRRQG